MKEPLNVVMLIDDNEDDNFFHERVISRGGFAKTILSMKSAQLGLDYIILHQASPEMLPDLIFLDINMPRMNGWEFLKRYESIGSSDKKGVVIMLTTSDNPNDIAKAEQDSNVLAFLTKPLSKASMSELVEKWKDHNQFSKD